jgi:hypothetical protein
VHAIVLAMRALFVALSLAAAGCTVGHRDYVSREGGLYDGRGNNLTFRHAFSEAAADKVRRQAERHCAETKLVAAKTRSFCTMTECTVDYQCMTGDEAARVAPADIKK